MYTTLPSLLSRVRDLEDHAAWHEFDQRYRELILRFCRRRGLQASDAEDVRQIVMLSLAKHLRGFSYQPSKGRFRAYLGRTVQNAISRYFRRPNHEIHGLNLDEKAAAAAPGIQERDSWEESSWEKVWETEWMAHHYRMAMHQLRKSVQPRSLEVFEHLLAGENVAQVAARFQISQEAVHKSKQRMRDRLKVLIARQILEEDGLDGNQSRGS
ncbi:MAG: sigma-70 family RNA polymerase sigma factor [Planctomycetota bacterium]|nr:MAG: sigma-70 family RNA polymerase sigma factor [Planctomycetota bacterium]